ncbi:MAG: serine--tRNA ligase [Crocinitomicaceae bacterium]|nr:serine--tRNA ligase [Crocinitomicaceae bacterium]|tara:strand:+ start:6506 stop:7780 length:1275 start_codon:yes stop_codon:yes gene_type:complete
MLEIQKIRENKDFIINRLNEVRKIDLSDTVNKIYKLDEQKRETQQKLDSSQAQLNLLSSQIGGLFKNGKIEEANSLKIQTALIKDQIKQTKEVYSKLESSIDELFCLIPNVPNELVPSGISENDNEIVSSSEINKDDFKSFVPHWDLCQKYNLIDFELGVKISGAGFPVYKGKGARLQRALINFFLNEASEIGYQELLVPHLVNEKSGFGTGQLPDKEGQMYHTEKDNLYLIPTAEVPITNIYRDVMVNINDFPIKHVGYTPCFRREAGSYGKDVRGLNRLHQFDKVEVVQITHPEKSYETLNEMVKYVESLLEKLELPYRKLKLCGGDLGFTSALTFDLEVYSPGQDRWLEVSSVSNFETFQSNRLKLRFKDGKKTKLAHTLNGSALALPRIMASLLEINQDEKGISIPKILIPFTGFDRIEN